MGRWDRLNGKNNKDKDFYSHIGEGKKKDTDYVLKDRTTEADTAKEKNQVKISSTLVYIEGHGAVRVNHGDAVEEGSLNKESLEEMALKQLGITKDELKKNIGTSIATSVNEPEVIDGNTDNNEHTIAIPLSTPDNSETTGQVITTTVTTIIELMNLAGDAEIIAAGSKQLQAITGKTIAALLANPGLLERLSADEENRAPIAIVEIQKLHDTLKKLQNREGYYGKIDLEQIQKYRTGLTNIRNFLKSTVYAQSGPLMDVLEKFISTQQQTNTQETKIED